MKFDIKENTVLMNLSNKNISRAIMKANIGAVTYKNRKLKLSITSGSSYNQSVSATLSFAFWAEGTAEDKRSNFSRTAAAKNSN